MDLEKAPQRSHESQGCLVVAIRVPVRIIVLVLVLPVRMVWDALVAGGRFLRDTVLRPVLTGWWRYVVTPLGQALVWLGKVLVLVPLGWLYRYLLTPLGHAFAWLYARVLTPVGHAVMWVLGAVGRALLWCAQAVGGALVWCVRAVGRVLFVVPALALWRWVLVPVGRVLGAVVREAGDALGHAWRIAGRISRAVGRALGTLLRWLVWEPLRWVYVRVLTPLGHVLRDVVLRPVAAVARAAGRAVRPVLASAAESVRQARADLRRMLFGGPAHSRAVDEREPTGGETRTLGSSSTALTKD